MTEVIPSAGLSHRFDFSARQKYRADHDLQRSRSAHFSVQPQNAPTDIWGRKPPDFRPQNYLPRPPKRNTRESMRPWRYSSAPSDVTRTEPARGTLSEGSLDLPKILQPCRPKSRKMLLDFDILSSDEARREAARSGQHPKSAYKNPQPHDHRQVKFIESPPDEAKRDGVRSGHHLDPACNNPQPHDHRQYPSIEQLGLPEFIACMSPDPFDIKFKTKNLDIHHGVPQPRKDEYMGDQMGHPRGPQPRYEPDLILPRYKWPNIPQEYTRHRPRVRTPHTALMDTIEARVTEQWATEKRETEAHHRQRRRRERHIRGIGNAVTERKHLGERVIGS